MSNTTLAAIKAKLLEGQKKSSGESAPRTGGDNASYPFWNIPVGSSATLRFLPDNDPDNVFFWQKREVIKLPFEGSVGGEYATNKKVTVNVPCIDMFGMSCPITAYIRPWWKDEEKKELARTYYKKKSYLFQGFVVADGVGETEVPENPIRRFVINPSLYEIIEKSLMDPEMEDAPTDYVNGCDFKIQKTQKGEYANYQTSQWSRRARSLTETELGAIDQHGLFTLKNFLGRVPDADEIAAITAMFHDSLDGKPFDTESYGQYYRAYSDRNSGDADAVSSTPARAAAPTQAPATVAAPVSEYVAEAAPAAAPVTPAVVTGSTASAADIMEKIRNRQAR
jgi:hypothetical protein